MKTHNTQNIEGRAHISSHICFSFPYLPYSNEDVHSLMINFFDAFIINHMRKQKKIYICRYKFMDGPVVNTLTFRNDRRRSAFFLITFHKVDQSLTWREASYESGCNLLRYNGFFLLCLEDLSVWNPTYQ